MTEDGLRECLTLLLLRDVAVLSEKALPASISSTTRWSSAQLISRLS